MANPTTNYGWPMPTATDLVTDLPADFAAFGQPVDTSLKALNPETTLGDISYRSATSNTNTRLGIGTTGQVLSVVAGVPAWTTGTAGDIEGVTAGTGISGGGTSGTVTVTNSMATAIDAKGDLIAGTGADAFSRLGVGANATVLTADSAEATGLKWATPSAPAFNGCRVTCATQSIAADTKTAVAWTVETFDTNSYHDNATNNSRMTVPTTGKYLVMANTSWDYKAGGFRKLGFMVNGTTDFCINSQIVGGATDGSSVNASTILSLTANDYVQAMATHSNTASDANYLIGGTTYSSFSIQYLGA